MFTEEVRLPPTRRREDVDRGKWAVFTGTYTGPLEALPPAVKKVEVLALTCGGYREA